LKSGFAATLLCTLVRMEPSRAGIVCGRILAVLYPTDPFPALPASRITLLVNWWEERPSGPVDLPSDLCFGAPSTTTSSTGTCETTFTARNRPMVPVGPVGQFVLDWPQWCAQTLPQSVASVHSERAGEPLLVEYLHHTGAPPPCDQRWYSLQSPE